MVSTFTTNKSLEKPGNGDYVDTWNIPVNGDMDVIDQAFGGVTNLNSTAGSATLTSAQYRSLIIKISGVATGTVTYTIPSGVGGQWIVYNGDTSNYDVKVASGGGGTSITLPQSNFILIASDGTNISIVAATPTVPPIGGGTNKIFYPNDQTITDSYVLTSSQNYGTFGPITINSGVVVTIPGGATWTIV
jgi:hypothetical protein